MRLAAQERGGPARREQRVELAVAQHPDQGLLLADRLEVEAGNRLERGALVAARLLLAAAAPMDVGRFHAILVLHDAAHPHHRGDLVLGQPDALALEVGGRADAGVGAHVDAGMPEQPRHEGRDAHIGRGAGRDGADIARERQLGDVEFLVAEGAEEDLLRVERQVGRRAALDLDAAILDGPAAVVVAAGDRDRHLDHGGSLSAVGWDCAWWEQPALLLAKPYWLPFRL